MEICNITSSKIETGRNTMRIMERFDRLLNRFVTKLYWENSNDLYVQRLIKLYGRPQNMVVEDHHEEEITEGITIAEPAAMEDVELRVIEHTAIEDAKQTQKEISLV